MLSTSKKEYFDPENKKHLKLFASYLFNNKWENPCPFWLEHPYTDIPSMCKDKILKSVLSRYK